MKSTSPLYVQCLNKQQIHLSLIHYRLKVQNKNNWDEN